MTHEIESNWIKNNAVTSIPDTNITISFYKGQITYTKVFIISISFDIWIRNFPQICRHSDTQNFTRYLTWMDPYQFQWGNCLRNHVLRSRLVKFIPSRHSRILKSNRDSSLSNNGDMHWILSLLFLRYTTLSWWEKSRLSNHEVHVYSMFHIHSRIKIHTNEIKSCPVKGTSRYK